jgi:hypothetical protein
VAWDLNVGETDKRTAIQSRHKGAHSRGISAPSQSSGLKNILLWWRPERGEIFGYDDGWSPGGDVFYFSGAGQTGDQEFGHNNFENGRVRDHVLSIEHLRLLRYIGPNTVRYIGELRLDPEAPWLWRDGPDRYGSIRKIIQFRMLPVGEVLRLPDDAIHDEPSQNPESEQVPALVPAPTPTDLEALGKKEFMRLLHAQAVLARRAELQLVHAFRDWLWERHRLNATGLRIPYAAEARNLRADLFIPEPRVLVEAKASSAREKIRMAIGQLLDYGRWLEPVPTLCVLLPNEPSPDMLELLATLEIRGAWANGQGTFELWPNEFLSD